MEWDLWTVFYSIVTFLIIESFYEVFLWMVTKYGNKNCS